MEVFLRNSLLCFVGSFSFNALSGKIMFRDVVYITYDYTARVQDGYLIFRWWRSYIPKDVSEGMFIKSFTTHVNIDSISQIYRILTPGFPLC